MQPYEPGEGIPLARIDAIVPELLKMLPSTEVVGSVARREDPVGDLDLLTTDSESLIRLTAIAEILAQGNAKNEGDWARVDYRGIPVGLLVVEPADLAAMRTWYVLGHRENARIKHYAAKHGWTFGPRGLRDADGRLLASTKENVLALLGIEE